MDYYTFYERYIVKEKKQIVKQKKLTLRMGLNKQL